MGGKEQIEKMTGFIQVLNDFLANQPPAKELDSSSAWLTDLNALAGNLAEMEGMAEGFISQLTYYAIKEMPDEEYKRIKSSSTLTTRYIQGKFPEQTRVVATILSYKNVLRQAADNTRTLLSSYRQEKEMEGRTQIRNTNNQNQ